MNFNRLHYEAPASKWTEVRMEQSVLSLSNGVNYSDVPGGVSGDDEYIDYDEL